MMTMRRLCWLWIALLLLGTVAHAWDFDEEVYICGTLGMSMAELQSAGITLVSHISHTREWMAEAARYGIRGMPYVSLYKVYDASAPGADRQHPFWSAVEITGHPEWVYIGANGQKARPFNNEFYPKVNWQSCTNTAGLAEAYARGVAGVIRNGAGGVFIDNVLPAKVCHGPQFGVHQHLYPDKDNIHSFKIALGQVQETLKGFGPNTVMMLNVGDWTPWQEFGDCMMLESFIYNIDVRPGPGGWVGNEIIRVKTWPKILATLKATADYVAGKGNIVTLEYLPEDPEAAFYTYACAKLGDYHWSPGGRVWRDVARALYRCRLQTAKGPLLESQGIYFRHYAGGMVAVNSTGAAVSARLPAPPDCASLADVWDRQVLPVRDGHLDARLPADAGRIYIEPTRLAVGLLREASVSLRTAQEKSVTPNRPPDPGFERACAAAELALRASPDAMATAVATLLRALDAGLQGPSQGAGTRLATGPQIAPKEALDLLKAEHLPSALRLTVESDRVVLANSSGDWALGGPLGAIRIGQLGMNVGVAENALHPQHGWLKPGRITNVKRLRDEAAVKAVEVTTTFVGGKTGQEIPGILLVLTAEVRHDDPALHVSAAVRNVTSRDLGIYAPWVTLGAGTWCSFPGQPAVQAGEYVQFESKGWTYVSPSSTGGTGLLLISDLAQSYSPYGIHLYSNPRNARLGPQQDRAFKFSLAVVSGAWQQQPEARAAVCRAQVNASSAWRLLTNEPARAALRGEAVAGRDATVALDGAPKAGLAGAELLNGPGLSALPSAVRVEDGRLLFALPPSLRSGELLRLLVRRAAQGADGRPVPLAEQLVIQPQPSLILAAESCAWSGRTGQVELTLTNRLSADAACRVTVSAPSGYKAPEAVRLTLKPGEKRRLPVTLTADQPSAPPFGVKAALTFEPEAHRGEQTVALDFLPKLICPTVQPAPAIDGKLDDPAWKAAAQTGPFGMVTDGSSPRETTEAFMARDGEFLYIAFRCRESRLDALVARTAPGKGSDAAVHADDSVEVFLQPDPTQKYLQLAANSRGAWKASRPVTWEVAAQRGDGEWTVEMRVRMDSLPARPTGTWRMNFCRMEQRLREASAWSPTGSTFHRPQRFGLVTFAE